MVVANECITTYNEIFLSLNLMDLQVLGCDVLSQESSATVKLFFTTSQPLKLYYLYIMLTNKDCNRILDSLL